MKERKAPINCKISGFEDFYIGDLVYLKEHGLMPFYVSGTHSAHNMPVVVGRGNDGEDIKVSVLSRKVIHKPDEPDSFLSDLYLKQIDRKLRKSRAISCVAAVLSGAVLLVNLLYIY